MSNSPNRSFEKIEIADLERLRDLTLGYFDDPVLSSYIRYRETDLARLMFHELAHQIVYVKDDSSFNESFAVAVEEEGLKRWLDEQPNAITGLRSLHTEDLRHLEESHEPFRRAPRRKMI